MTKFRLYWVDGSTEVTEGSSIADAFTNAGYGNGARSALELWHEGDDVQYFREDGKWISDPSKKDENTNL